MSGLLFLVVVLGLVGLVLAVLHGLWSIEDGRRVDGVQVMKDGFVACYLVDLGEHEVALADTCNDRSAKAILAAPSKGTSGQSARCSSVLVGDNHSLAQPLADETAALLGVGPLAPVAEADTCAAACLHLPSSSSGVAQTRGGHLINISSVLGTKVRPTAGAYAGTKHAIEALSEALRMELAGSGVQITCIEPGLVRTELHHRWPIHPSESMGIPHPLQPEDVARCVGFVLCQPAHVRIPRIMVVPGEHAI